MHDGAALLAAIAACPAKDVPKLAFADWLDEIGEPLQAELVRLQVEARRPDLPRRLPLLKPREMEFVPPPDAYVESMRNIRPRPLPYSPPQTAYLRCLVSETAVPASLSGITVEVYIPTYPDYPWPWPWRFCRLISSEYLELRFDQHWQDAAIGLFVEPVILSPLQLLVSDLAARERVLLGLVKRPPLSLPPLYA